MIKVLFVFFLAVCVHAQNVRQIFGTGGSVAGNSANTSAQTSGVAGQNVIGEMSGGNFGTGSGFAEIYRSPILLDAPNGPEPLPTDFSFPQNFPNPFNPSTTFQFSLPRASHVRLVLIDLLGRETVEIMNTQLPAGNYAQAWHSPGDLASGVYFARLDAGEFHSIRKVVLLK